jgi:hypothetical protein
MRNKSRLSGNGLANHSKILDAQWVDLRGPLSLFAVLRAAKEICTAVRMPRIEYFPESHFEYYFEIESPAEANFRNSRAFTGCNYYFQNIFVVCCRRLTLIRLKVPSRLMAPPTIPRLRGLLPQLHQDQT